MPGRALASASGSERDVAGQRPPLLVVRSRHLQRTNRDAHSRAKEEPEAPGPSVVVFLKRALWPALPLLANRTHDKAGLATAGDRTPACIDNQARPCIGSLRLRVGQRCRSPGPTETSSISS